ncbi:hypothetical protein Q1695_007510 [Nippostrongylus brasiliensis]|nr:hypothetical protein Q1695_007510 [Nippostrongylus brasiliensis]
MEHEDQVQRVDALHPAEQDSSEIAEGANMVFRCGECIGCFQSEDCGRCNGCTSSSSCLRRKCVQESVLANRKPTGALAQRREQIRKEVQSEVVKKDVKREATPTAVKRGPGRPRKEAGQANARAGAQIAETARTGMDERAPPRRSTATRARGEPRRKHDAPKQPESRQCIEPDCVNEAREDSKYCSDECGLKLAKMRLLMLLPQKVAQYYGQQPLSELQSLEELRAIDQKIGKIQAQTETMLGYVRAIQRYVMAMKSTTSVSYDEPGDVDFMVNCTVCGMETNGRQLPKHVERCFVKSEKQTSFGTATPAAFNPDNLFCEAYNKANNTYCKRVRVICAEHYKGELENELQVCAYPKAWSEGKSLTFAEMFAHGPDLLKDQGFCCAPRKDCAQHHRWVQALVGTIECERMNLLTRLDELLERRKVVSVGCSTRGDVISLLNFQPPVIVDSSK